MAEVRDNPICDVVEVVVDVHDTRKRRNCFTVDESIGNGVACGEAAGNRNEVAHLEFCRCLRFNQFKNVRDGYAGHGIVFDVATGMEGRLEVDSADGGVLDSKIDDLADFMFVDAALDCWNERDV